MENITIIGHCEIAQAERAGDVDELEKLVISVRSLGQVSDGYHTIEELYDHRITLFIALCKRLQCDLRPPRMGQRVWRSKTHHDGTSWDGWFIIGIDRDKGEQISYHLPLSRWEETNFADTLERAPEWDGHTSADVLERLKTL